MFATGFQSAAFQTVWAYVTGQRDSHDIAAYKRYRKKIEKLAKIADEREQKKFIKTAEKIAKIAQPSIPASAEKIEKIIEQAKVPEIDFSIISFKLAALLAQLEIELEKLILKKQEEELIILLLAE